VDEAGVGSASEQPARERSGTSAERTENTAWPFWAATSDERIDRAFELAVLQPGEHLIDLGCGDGRVLLRAAAFHQARVTGVELDAELAATARRLLADHDQRGQVVEADFAEADLAGADVVFAYLSPATLQRLRPRLATELRRGARVVTTGYAVPGWEPVEAGGRCFLYRVPVEESDVDRARRGWDTAGALVALHPDVPSLVAVKLHHHGGPVAVHVAGGEEVAVRTGADHAEPGDEVVVDLRFDPRPDGSRLAAAIDAGDGGRPFQVFAVFDAGEPGVWGLAEDGCGRVAAAFAGGDLSALLAAARS
jgi:SAM-dependent methyltransferase